MNNLYYINTQPELMPIYKATHHNTQQHYSISAVPKAPQFTALTPKQSEELVNNARAHDEESLNLLLNRMYWGASKNPFTLDDLLNIKNIQEKASLFDGHIYWALIIKLDAFKYFPGLADAIKDLAEKSKVATAQYAYGSMHESGRGFSSWGDCRNTKAALYWWQKAADQGFAPALFALGYCYNEGLGGLKKNERLASDFYRRASELGYLPASHFLGLSYLKAQGVEQDIIKALRLILGSHCDKDSKSLMKQLIARQRTRTYNDLDNTLYLNNLYFKSSTYFNDLTQTNFADYLRKDIDKQLVREHFESFINDHRQWMMSFISIIEDLKAIEPGFFITSHRYKGNKDHFESQKEDRFIYNYKLLKYNYLTIGTHNNIIAQKLLRYFDDFNNIINSYKKLIKFCARTKEYYLGKIDTHKALGDFYESKPEHEEEFELHKRKLFAYQAIMPDFQQALLVVNFWINAAKNFNQELEYFIEEGAGERNKRFMELYYYLE
jgi:TPR repeat protein